MDLGNLKFYLKPDFTDKVQFCVVIIVVLKAPLTARLGRLPVFTKPEVCSISKDNGKSEIN